MVIPRKFDIRTGSYDVDLASRLAVALDGVEQNLCVAYDTDEGWIVRYLDGALPHTGEIWPTEQVEGAVTVTLLPVTAT
jgi:hypothetical protein